MIVAALALSVAAFILVLRLAGTVAAATRAAATARDAARALRSPGLGDAEKEALSRRAAAALFASFLRIAATGLLALGLSLAVIWLGAAAGLYDLAAALTTAAGWPFLLGATAVVTLAWLVAGRLAGRVP
jgi:hypothetical protein